MISVRPATLDDLESLVAVYNASWRQGFVDIFPVTTFTADHFDDDRRHEMQESLLDDAITTSVVDVDDRLVGFGAVTMENGTPCVDDMWIHPHSWGCGASQALLAAIEDEHRAIGIERLTTWIPEEGRRVRGFAEKMGWNPTGAMTPMGLFPDLEHQLIEYDRILV